ncbi:hypothetical protein Pelo_12279 [Pelomyxa schiedti]|nr:hypothetical protein Pelo_12279 [Pelomyxa schiedti]
MGDAAPEPHTKKARVRVQQTHEPNPLDPPTFSVKKQELRIPSRSPSVLSSENVVNGRSYRPSGLTVCLSARAQFVAFAVGAIIARCGSGFDKPRAAALSSGGTGKPASRAIMGRRGSPEWIVGEERRAAFTLEGTEWEYCPNSWSHYSNGPHIFVTISFTLGIVRYNSFYTSSVFPGRLLGWFGTEKKAEPTTSTSAEKGRFISGSTGSHGDRLLLETHMMGAGNAVEVVDNCGHVVKCISSCTSDRNGMHRPTPHCNKNWIVLAGTYCIELWKVKDGLPLEPPLLLTCDYRRVKFCDSSLDYLLLFGRRVRDQYSIQWADLQKTYETQALCITKEILLDDTAPVTSVGSGSLFSIIAEFPQFVDDPSREVVLSPNGIYNVETQRTFGSSNCFVDAIGATHVSVLDNGTKSLVIYHIKDLDTPCLTLEPLQIADPTPAVQYPCMIPFQSGLVVWKSLSKKDRMFQRYTIKDLVTGVVLIVLA